MEGIDGWNKIGKRGYEKKKSGEGKGKKNRKDEDRTARKNDDRIIELSDCDEMQEKKGKEGG